MLLDYLINPRPWYKLSDNKENNFGVTQINFKQASAINEKGFGIFWTHNDFNGDRKKENLVRVNAFAVDIDDGTKEIQRDRIKKLLAPSMVVESKNGYHVYYAVKDFEPDAEKYRDFMLDYFLHNLKGDKKATDASRLLRVPCFYHMKNPSDPYFVSLAYSTNICYSVEEIKKHFPASEDLKKIQKQRDAFKSDLKFQSDGDLWHRIFSMDQMEALKKLSGDDCVSGDVFDFRRTQSGNYNILVNRKGTSCWIDKEMRIGSADEGGPTVFQWVNWYQKDGKKTYEIIKNKFPEVFKNVV